MGASQGTKPAPPQGPTKEERLKHLQTKGISVESWSVKDLKEWLSLLDVNNEELYKFIDAYKLDGESILNLDTNFFDTLVNNYIPKEILSKFTSLMLQTKETEMIDQLKYTVSYRPLDEKFAPYSTPDQPHDLILFYHQVTKNTPTSGSRSLNHDWTQQPRVFRRYYGSPCIPLEKLTNTDYLYNNLYINSPTTTSPLSLLSLSHFFYLSFALSARKPNWQALAQPRSAWSKRVNASSGGLHPVEAYVIVPSIDRLGSGVYHYSPKEHCLEQRCVWPEDMWEDLPAGTFLVALATATWYIKRNVFL